MSALSIWKRYLEAAKLKRESSSIEQHMAALASGFTHLWEKGWGCPMDASSQMERDAPHDPQTSRRLHGYAQLARPIQGLSSQVYRPLYHFYR